MMLDMPLSVERHCETCYQPLQRRDGEHPTTFLKRRTCDRRCGAKLSAKVAWQRKRRRIAHLAPPPTPRNAPRQTPRRPSKRPVKAILIGALKEIVDRL